MINIAWKETESNFKKLHDFMDPSKAISIYQDTQKLFFKQSFIFFKQSFVSKSDNIKKMLSSLSGLVEDKDKGITFSGNIEKIKKEIKDLNELLEYLSSLKEPLPRLREMSVSIRAFERQLDRVQQEKQISFDARHDETHKKILRLVRLAGPHVKIDEEDFNRNIKALKDEIESLKSFQEKYIPNPNVVAGKINELEEGVKYLEQQRKEQNFRSKFDIPNIEIEAKGKGKGKDKEKFDKLKKYLDRLDKAQIILSKESKEDADMWSDIASEIVEARSQVTFQLRQLEIEIKLPTDKTHDGEIKRTTKAIAALCKANDKGAEAWIRSLNLDQLKILGKTIDKRNEYMSTKSGVYYRFTHRNEKEQLKIMKERVEERIKFLEDPSTEQKKDNGPKNS